MNQAKALPKSDPYKSQLERNYAKRLEGMVSAGDVLEWKYEPMRVRLGKNMNYTVDFMLLMPDQTVECHEVKGYHANIRDSRSKWKMAAELIPWFRWKFVTLKKKEWVSETY